MRYTSRFSRIAISLAAISFISFVGCQKSSSGGMGDETGFPDDGTFSQNGNYDPSFSNGVSIGSGLSAADKAALNNVDKEMQQVAPTQDWQIPADMQSQIDQLLAQEKQCVQGDSQACINVTQLKMSLAQQILVKCMATVNPLAPKTGQPLLGSWSGGGACPVKFDVTGTGDNGAYTVGNGNNQGAGSQLNSGAPTGNGIRAGKKEEAPPIAAMSSINGTLQAAADGTATLKSSSFNGKVTDQPTSGHGTLTNANFKKTKYGFDPCTVNVALQESTNPIPKNYEEAMKKAGSCHRKALMLMSPIFDNLFKSLPPQAVQMLQMQSLGIQK
jgi:hypothetical protein